MKELGRERRIIDKSTFFAIISPCSALSHPPVSPLPLERPRALLSLASVPVLGIEDAFLLAPRWGDLL
jgi:hypothetical protein